MSLELDDVVDAFAAVQDQLAGAKDQEQIATFNRAIDALLMAIGAIESRLIQLEQPRVGKEKQKRAEPEVRTGRTTREPKIA